MPSESRTTPCLALTASISFDASTLEIWGALLHGGRCVLYPERVPSPWELGTQIQAHGVDTLWLTSALFNTVIDEAPDARRHGVEGGRQFADFVIAL